MQLKERPSSKPESPTYREAGRLARVRLDEGKAPVSDREAERLAEKIVAVGSDYIEKKSLERYGEEGQAPDNAPPTMHADDLANKLMKEAARETARETAKRNDGQAALAAKDQPDSPMHKVAEKVHEKMAFAEERATSPHAFVGVNPDAGSEGSSEKKRHMRNKGEHITGSFRQDVNPDVQKESGAMA
ncbi:hypothetical protein COHA_007955 [Chlorella ohadii]|uniref:SMP domain-containing protein n=1 Tax=Chlorella ohadii TaxID=2649997 RepID=A0AAD5GZC2_9CHLO|nr:hypothetical protein COHA_007955 [Chlorella ohadii]